jgi:hypothetical protein
MEATLFRPATIGLRSAKRSDYKSQVGVGGRLGWECMSGGLDWSTVDDLAEFYVRVRYIESIETRHKSNREGSEGRRDYRRVPHGRRFSCTICKVQRGRGNHLVRIQYADGSISKRVIPESEVIGVVRLFLSAQYARGGLNILPGVQDRVKMIIQLEREVYDE